MALFKFPARCLAWAFNNDYLVSLSSWFPCHLDHSIIPVLAWVLISYHRDQKRLEWWLPCSFMKKTLALAHENHSRHYSNSWQKDRLAYFWLCVCTVHMYVQKSRIPERLLPFHSISSKCSLVRVVDNQCSTDNLFSYRRILLTESKILRMYRMINDCVAYWLKIHAKFYRMLIAHYPYRFNMTIYLNLVSYFAITTTCW